MFLLITLSYCILEQINYSLIDGWNSDLFLLCVDSKHLEIEGPACFLYNNIFTDTFIPESGVEEVHSDILLFKESDIDDFFAGVGSMDYKDSSMISHLVKEFHRYGFHNKNLTVRNLRDIIRLTPIETDGSHNVFGFILYSISNEEVVFLYSVFIRRFKREDKTLDCFTVLHYPGIYFPYRFLDSKLHFMTCKKGTCDSGLCNSLYDYVFTGSDEVEIKRNLIYLFIF